jgi:hypothetical protein
MFKLLADVVKPVLTIIVTIILLLILASVFSPDINIWIQNHLPVWERLEPMV